MSSDAKKGSIPVWSEPLYSLDLPGLSQLMDSPWSRTSWKKHVKCLLNTNALLSHQSDCSHLPISEYLFESGKPLPHWSVTRSLPILTRQSNFHIRLLLGCDGLEHDACRFRTRRFPGTAKLSVCKLCLQEPEDQAHFIARCPRLEAVCSQLLLMASLPCSHYDQPIISTSLLELSWVRRGSMITRLRNLPLTFSTTCISTGTLYSQDHTDSAHEGLLSQCGGYPFTNHT